MRNPKYIHPGNHYSLAARCCDRKFKLVPSDDVNQVVGFCLAHAARKYAVAVHAWVVMSDHIHLEVTDPRGWLPKFLGLFKSLVARALNCRRGAWEVFWAPPPKAHMLVTTYEDAVHRMGYVLVQAVAAGLVDSPEKWPGVGSLPEHLGATLEAAKTWVFHKPDFFFRPEKRGGKVPDQVSLTLTPHPLAGDQPEQFLADVLAEVDRLIRDARQEARRRKRRFKGARRVLRHRWWDTPKTTADRRRLVPRFCAKNVERRVAIARGYVSWRSAHAAAMDTWRKTGRATFPAGTYAMRGLPGVTVRDGPVLWQRA